MNKRLIASLLTVSIVAGAGLNGSVQLMASTVPTSNQSRIMNQVDEQILEAKGIITSQFKEINSLQYLDYEKAFKVTGVTGYTNNGGRYSGSVLERAFDRDIRTHWETGRPNNSTFKNEVIITFDDVEMINRIAYAPRPGNKGHVKQMSIYASLTESGDDFELVARGSTNVYSSVSEFRFQKAEFKRLKFVFDQAHQDWAAAGEFMFFKEDTVGDKVNRLFTDATMSEVSEEFNSIEKIQVLGKEVKEHPFYEEYKNDLADAIALIEQGEIETTDAKINKFMPFYTPYIDEYDEVFRVPNSKIEKLSNNGGKYGKSALEYAIDDDVETHWETGKANSDIFKNEISITLDSAQVIDRITYKSRTSTKGFPINFSIYISPTESGDNFRPLATGNYTVTSDLLEVQFNKTNVRRLKFVFDRAKDNWASIGDLRLYKEDKTYDKMKTLFTNGLMNEVSEAFNTIEKLDMLRNEIKGHPLEAVFKGDIQLAKGILQGNIETTKVVVAEQKGNMSRHASDNLKFGFGNNNQPTGIVAKPGETIIIYLDADPSNPLPRVMFSQQEASFANWGKTVNLHHGKNVITVPTINKDEWYKHEVTKGGPVYIVNPYTSEEQSKVPVIRFVGGDQFPLLTADTNVEEFKQFLIEYKQRIDADTTAHPNVLDRKVIDTFEFVSDHIVWTGTATGAYKTYIEYGINPLETIESYNIHMREIFKYYGLDGSSLNNDPKNIRENVRLAQPFGYMYAGAGHIGVQRDVMANHLVPFEKRGPSWGLTHEIGHKMDVNARLMGEVTNNMLPMHMSVFYGQIDKRIPYETHTYKNVLSEHSNVFWEGGFFEKLAPFWQLETYSPGYWGELNKLYRERSVDLGEVDADSQKLQFIIRFSSEVLGEDLTEYFARHGYNVTEETKQETSQYPKSGKKIWYLNNNKINYKGNGFTQDTDLKIKVFPEEKGNKLVFNINDEVKSDLLGYEIFKDDKLIGFTAMNSFLDVNVEKATNAKYEVIPYDLNLGKGESAFVNLDAPSIKLKQYYLTLGLNSLFNPLDYVEAFNNKGENISSSIKFEHDVDSSKKGVYKIKYTVVDEGGSSEEALKIEIVGDFTYASDLDWASATTDFKTVNKDMAHASTSKIKLQVANNSTEFDKGIGTCGNSAIVYNLEGKGMTHFSSHIGLDTNYSINQASVVFKVIADGKEIYDSGTMKKGSNAKFINLPIEGVKELKLVTTDSGNGIKGDFASWGGAKFTTNSAIPNLEVQDKVIQLGQPVDFMEGITAHDAEDGDLTSKIKILSNSYEEGKVGKFEVIYSIMDSDSNKVEKKVYITIYEDVAVKKSKYGQFDNLAEYNEQFKLPISDVSNNGRNYGSSVIARAIDGDLANHWETGKPNSNTFRNEVIFDLGKNTDIDKMAYAARRGGKGFANKFEVYVSSEAEGNDFILAGKGEYNNNGNDVIEFKLRRSNVRRIKFVFVEANQGWASIGEVAFYKADPISDKVMNDLFIDVDKTQVAEAYNTLEKLDALREEVKNHPAAVWFEADLNKAEAMIKTTFPTLEIPKDGAIKVGEYQNDIYGTYSAMDTEDGDLTSEVEVSGSVDFDQPGTYRITYKVMDSDGNEVTKTRDIAVVDMNDFTYVSDYDWIAASCGWGSIKKDQSPSDNMIRLTDENNQEVQFKKGLGTHARSVIKYDLTDKEAEYFSAYVGVDRGMYGSVASVGFEVWLDGEKVAETDVIRSRDAMQYLEVNLAGAKELMIVATDGGNGNGSDHAAWGDAKFHFANENRVKVNAKVNAKVLRSLIEEINQLNEENYTADSWAKLIQVKNEALSLLENVVTQEQVDEMIERLTDAKKSLIKVGAKVELESLVRSINDLEAHIYTAESWQALAVKLEAAKEVLALEEVPDETVDATKEELQVAIDSLEVSKGKSGLYELLKVANTMEQSHYAETVDWVTFEEMRAYYNDLYWAVATHREDMYEEAINYFSWLIEETESHRIINIEGGELEVEQPEVEQPEVEQPEVEQPEVEQPEVEQPEIESPEVK